MMYHSKSFYFTLRLVQRVRKSRLLILYLRIYSQKFAYVRRCDAESFYFTLRFSLHECKARK